MTNLIPPDAKTAVRREYWFRTATVWAFMLSVCFFVFSALSLPTYVLFSAQLSALEHDAENAGAEDETTYQDALDEINAANDIAVQLSRISKHQKASALLSAVENAQSGSITINSFRYNLEGDSVKEISVSGIAGDRTSLKSFADALERNPLFMSAEVPVSDLVRDRDLPFSITVTVDQNSN